jgi:hypothetical protein
LDRWDWSHQHCVIPDFFGTAPIASPGKVVKMWRLEFEAMRAEGACYVLANHPFLSGRPSRARAVSSLDRAAQSSRLLVVDCATERSGIEKHRLQGFA